MSVDNLLLVWYDDLLSLIPGITYIRHELGADSGHDTTLFTKEVVGDIFDWVKATDI